MLTIDLSRFPELATERLSLREIVRSDARELLALRSDPKVMEYIGRPRATSVTEMKELVSTYHDGRMNNASVAWAIAQNGSEKLIGTIGFWRMKPEHFRAEVGYLLAVEHWGKGFMVEAMNAVLRFGFEGMGLHSVEAVTEPANAASRRVLEKCAFVQEGYFKESWFYDGKFFDSVVYSRLAPKK